MTDGDDDPPESSKPPTPRPLRPAVRAFVSRKDVVKWVFAHGKAALPDEDHEQEAQGALTHALERTKWPDSDVEGVLWAVLRATVDGKIADYHRKRARRAEYEGDMPEVPQVEDEVGERAPDPEADIDPAHDPRRADDARIEGMLLRRFLATAVRGDARDEETYGWLVAWSDEDAGYAEISRQAGLPLTTVHSRVHEFKGKYLPRYRRWRDRAVVFLFLLALAVALAVALLVRRHRTDDIRFDPDTLRPVPSGSVSATPVPPAPPPPFDNALPTQPDDTPRKK